MSRLSRLHVPGGHVYHPLHIPGGHVYHPLHIPGGHARPLSFFWSRSSVVLFLVTLVRCPFFGHARCPLCLSVDPRKQGCILLFIHRSQQARPFEGSAFVCWDCYLRLFVCVVVVAIYPLFSYRNVQHASNTIKFYAHTHTRTHTRTQLMLFLSSLPKHQHVTRYDMICKRVSIYAYIIYVHSPLRVVFTRPPRPTDWGWWSASETYTATSENSKCSGKVRWLENGEWVSEWVSEWVRGRGWRWVSEWVRGRGWRWVSGKMGMVCMPRCCTEAEPTE